MPEATFLPLWYLRGEGDQAKANFGFKTANKNHKDCCEEEDLIAVPKEPCCDRALFFACMSLH